MFYYFNFREIRIIDKIIIFAEETIVSFNFTNRNW